MTESVNVLRLSVDSSGVRTGSAEVVRSFADIKAQAQALLGLLGTGFAAVSFGGLIRDSAQLAARMQTLDVVLTSVGRNAGYSAQEVRAAVAGMQQYGITALSARDAATKLLQSQLDLSKATQLVRVAQDAAVIANTNSTEAFDRLLHGIRTGNQIILRSLGIFVDTEQAVDTYAASIGRAATSLSRIERQQALFNAVLQQGEQIAGTYEAAMTTANKILGSTDRLLEDAKGKFGQLLLPAYVDLVFKYYNALSAVNKELDAAAQGESWTKAQDAVRGIAEFLPAVVVGLGAGLAAPALLGALRIMFGPAGLLAAGAGVLVTLALREDAATKVARAYAEQQKRRALTQDELNKKTQAAIDLEARKQVAEERAAAARRSEEVRAGRESLFGSRFGDIINRNAFGVFYNEALREFRLADRPMEERDAFRRAARQVRDTFGADPATADLEAYAAAIRKLGEAYKLAGPAAEHFARLILDVRKAELADIKERVLQAQLEAFNVLNPLNRGRNNDLLLRFNRLNVESSPFSQQVTAAIAAAGMQRQQGGQLVPQAFAEYQSMEQQLRSLEALRDKAAALRDSVDRGNPVYRMADALFQQNARNARDFAAALDFVLGKVNPLVAAIRGLNGEISVLSLPLAQQAAGAVARQAFEARTGRSPNLGELRLEMQTPAFQQYLRLEATRNILTARTDAERARADELTAREAMRLRGGATAQERKAALEAAARAFGVGPDAVRDAARAVRGELSPLDLRGQQAIATYRQSLATAAANRQLSGSEWWETMKAQADAANLLNAAMRTGEPLQVRDAQLKAEALKLAQAQKISYEQALRAATMLNTALGGEAAERAIQQLRRQVELSERLFGARFNPAAQRRLSVESGLRDWRFSNPFAAPDQASRQRELLERQQRQQLVEQAAALQGNYDSTLRYREELAKLNDLYRQGLIDVSTYNAALRDTRISMLEGQRDLAAGVERSFLKMQKNAEDYARVAEDFIGNGLRNLEDRFVELGKTGRINWKSLVDFMLEYWMRFAFQQLSALIGSLALQLAGGQGQQGSAGGFAGIVSALIGGATSGSAGGGGSWGIWGFHGGGNVGTHGSHRTAPAGLFASAPRLHSGLMPDEFPAILQRGERVLSRDEVRGDRGVNVNLEVHPGVAQTVRVEMMNMMPTLKRQIQQSIASDKVHRHRSMSAFQ